MPEGNSSGARRLAAGAPMPREAAVTIATLLLSWVILSLLIVHCGTSAFDGEEMSVSPNRIIIHYPASQSENREQRDGQIRRHAGVHAGGGATELHARRAGSRRAALDRDGRGEAARSAARRASPRADPAPCQPDPPRRDLSPAPSPADCPSPGCRRGGPPSPTPRAA